MEISNAAISSDSYLNRYLRSTLQSDITKSLWLGKTLGDNLAQPPLKAESSRAVWPGPSPVGLRISPRMETFWTTWSSVEPPSQAFSCVEMDCPIFNFVPIASHPFTSDHWKKAWHHSAIWYLYILIISPQDSTSHIKFVFSFSYSSLLVSQCGYSVGLLGQNIFCICFSLPMGL